VKTILSRSKKLLKIPYFKVAAVIFVGLIFILTSRTIAGSFGNYPIDGEAEIIRKSSSFYAAKYLNPEEVIIEEAYTDGEFFDSPGIVVQKNALLATASPTTISSFLGEQRSGTVTYEVQPGDIPSQVAASFGISTNTLLWANNLSSWDLIKPGQKLVILPVSGIRHTVVKGESLEAIVKKYKGDVNETIEFNSLPADGKLAVGQEIIIPNGQKPIYYLPQTKAYATYDFSRPFADISHRFPWGQCTWYVAQRRYIPWGGNAKTWLQKAQQYGFATGNEPQPGAIVVTRDNPYYGHVAYVERVNESQIIISEMHLGYGIQRVRAIPINSYTILGYIY